MDRAATVSEFIQHLCAPADTTDVKTTPTCTKITTDRQPG